jgi:hypothetical protein
MSWHAKQRHNITLEAERASLEAQLKRAAIEDERKASGRNENPRPLSESQMIAASLLELLPVDPDATRHRQLLNSELHKYDKREMA